MTDPSRTAPEQIPGVGENPFGVVSGLDRPLSETMREYRNPLAVPALVVAILVWPVGLVLSAVAFVRSVQRGGVGRYPAVGGLVAAALMCVITFAVVDTIREANPGNDPACRPALADLSGQPVAIDAQQQQLHADLGDSRATADDLDADVAAVRTLDFHLAADVRAARNDTVRNAVGATRHDVELYLAGLTAQQQGGRGAGSKDVLRSLRLANDQQDLVRMCHR